jgi:AraC-like DNA-binding protein
MPVTEIALELGFSSGQYFATTFRRLTGAVPAAFRRQARRGGAKSEEEIRGHSADVSLGESY